MTDQNRGISGSADEPAASQSDAPQFDGMRRVGNVRKPGKRVLAVASAGGHWHQLQLSLAECDRSQIHFVTTLDGLPQEAGLSAWTIVRDCNRNEIGRALLSFAQLGRIFLAYRPEIVVSTGAFPGLLAIVWGRLTGAYTVWIDSVANAESLSGSGKIAKRFAKVCLSQWPHVADAEGVRFEGSVL